MVTVRRRAAPLLATLATLATLVAAGCGADEGSERGGPDQAAADTVTALERALTERDYEAICDRLFTPEFRARAGGNACASRLRRRAAGVRDPRIAVESIVLGPRGATALVRTSADNQPPARDTIELVERNGLKIASIGG